MGQCMSKSNIIYVLLGKQRAEEVVLGFIGPQGTSIVRRSPRVCRIPYKSGQLFSHFLKKFPRKCNKIQEHFLNVG